MANAYTGFVALTGGVNAHELMVDRFETVLQANAWTTLRKFNAGGAGNARKYELIMRGKGLSGLEDIYIGFQCYQSSDADYYNISFSVFTGYVPANPFDSQPGINVMSVCAHNQRIDYWIHVNGQAILFGLKVGTPVYDIGYLGKFFPYCPPSQYPYPVVCSGTLVGRPGTRYSDTNRRQGLYGGLPNMVMRTNFGQWASPYTTFNTSQVTNTRLRDSNSHYSLVPVELCDFNADDSTPSSNVYGRLDGVFWITGFNNVTENTLSINGRSYVVIQNIFRVGFSDYFALDVTP